MMVLEEEVFEITKKVSEVGFCFFFFFFAIFTAKDFLLLGDSGERQVLDKESCSEQCRDSYPTCGDVKNLQEH